jgi:endoglucanase
MNRFLPFDWSQIVPLLFQVVRLFSLTFLLLLSACTPASTIQRGINMGDMLEAPKEGDWGLTVEEEYFDLIKEAGFDFVRLPVRWNAYAEVSAPYSIDPAFFARVDEVLGWALERELAIIIDFHHYEEMASDPVGHKDRFLGIWRQVAEHYRDHPPTVLFELLNEPTANLNPSLWNEYLIEALKIVRETNPTRDVIVEPVLSNGEDLFSELEIPTDRHLIVTFHYYLPFQFTHQGAEWVGAEAENWLGTTWDATEAEKAEITAHFDSVAEWAKRQDNVRILLGEFGAYSKADMDSRVRWTEYVAREAERHGFAWSYWEFASGFGVYDPEAKAWREELLKALIP